MPNDLNNLRVVVTGGAGFVGGHLVDLLVSEGATVYVIDDYSRGKPKWPTHATYIKADAGNVQQCEWVFRGGLDGGIGRPVDIVFNLAAAVAGVEYNSQNNHVMYLENAPLQTAPVVAAERAGVPTFVQISSACVYDPNHNSPAVEEAGYLGEPHVSNYGYGWAKRMGEKLALHSKIDNVAVLRPSNIYGPEDYFDDKAHVIPSLIRQYHEGKARMIGGGESIREFLYVKDAARAMLHAALLLHGSKNTLSIYNVGTNGDTKISIKELHNLIAATLGSDAIVSDRPERINPELARWSDSSKLIKTGWQHEYGIADGIKETVEWYLEQI